MRVALVVNKIALDREKNINKMLKYIDECSNNKADLVIFSEMSINGFRLTDVPEEDIKMGIDLKGEVIKSFCHKAKENNINVALGILEKCDKNLYDSAIFINRLGEISYKYRRISIGWRHPKMVDNIYKEGNEVKAHGSDIGKVTFLICGDLFDDDLLKKVKKLKVDFLLYPLARSAEDGNMDHDRWVKEELDCYMERVKMCETTTLFVNHIDNPIAGGAYVISRNGEVLDYLKIGKEGILYYDF